MSDLNVWNGIGRLGADPETRQVGSTSVCTFNIAMTEKWKSANDEKQERTTWLRIECWAKLGEIAQAYLAKGSQVFISGTLQIDEYEKDGVKKSMAKIKARDMQLLGGRPDGQSSAPAPSAPAAAGGDDFSDSVPF